MSKVKNTLISAMAIGLLAGSAVGVAAQTDDEPSSASTGCDGPLVEPGVYDGVNDIGEAQQAYRVVVPEGYADLAPAPLILDLATDLGFLDPAFEMWSPYLGPAESIFVTAELTHFTHLAPATLVALINHLAAEYCVDPRQVHAMGQDSSASSVAALACEAPGRIASFYGGMGSFPPKCDSPRPVPLESLTGDADRELVSRSVEAWAENSGCDPEPVEEDLGSGVTRKEYQGCEADIVLYDVEGAGHGFVRQECIDNRRDYCYANDAFDQLREVERFFAEHPLPAAE